MTVRTPTVVNTRSQNQRDSRNVSKCPAAHHLRANNPPYSAVVQRRFLPALPSMSAVRQKLPWLGPLNSAGASMHPAPTVCF